jgi:HPt (histidine-containing phosphotransfer) domain-containing protein
VSDPAIDQETLRRLLDITGGDPAFVDELIDTYLQDGEAQIEAMRAAEASGDVAGLVRPAHTLKSSSASIGALALADHCRTLEADARAGTVPDAADRIDAAATAFADARAALASARSVDR